MTEPAKKALFWEDTGAGDVTCHLCHHGCGIRPGQRGLCMVRENRGGVLYTLNYARVAARGVDPIEKKPLYHFLPGSRSLSVAARGCNFRCRHCQNCDIARIDEHTVFDRDDILSPGRTVSLAENLGCRSIAYTYTEPTIFFEYALETARRAADRGIKNVFVTNGYITPRALLTVNPYLDAANIDLKFFDDDSYRRICGARLGPVLDMIRLYRDLEIWIELTTLVIPGVNDTDEELARIAAFIAALGTHIPWHVTAFRPAHEMTDTPGTPPATLKRAVDIGMAAGVKYVYPGNSRLDGALETRCPSCGNPVMDRRRMPVDGFPAGEMTCGRCGCDIEGVWK